MKHLRAIGIRHRSNGDTIVEVLITCAILSLLLVGAYGVSNHSTKAIRDTQEHQEAASLASAQVEYLRHNEGLTTDNDCFTTDGSEAKVSPGNDCSFYSQGTAGCSIPGTAYCYNAKITPVNISMLGADISTTYRVTISWANGFGGTGNEDLYYRIGRHNPAYVPPAASPLAPYYSCVGLAESVLNASQRIFSFTATANLGNGATLSGADFTFGDSMATNNVLPSGTTAGTTHQYGAPGSYIATATLNFMVNGIPKTDICSTNITTALAPPPPPFSPCTGDYIHNFMSDAQLKAPTELNLRSNNLEYPFGLPGPTPTQTYNNPSGLPTLANAKYKVTILSYDDHVQTGRMSTDQRPASAPETDMEGVENLRYESYRVTVYDANGSHTTPYTNDIPDNVNIGTSTSTLTLKGKVTKLVATHIPKRDTSADGTILYGEGISPVCISFTKL